MRLLSLANIYKMKPLNLLLIFSSVFWASSVNAGWEVSWIEKFDGDGVNWDNWTAQTQANYNNEIQCYTDDDTTSNRNYEVSDGTLKIIARRQNINCPGQNNRNRDWTSGRLNSKDKAEFLYGRIEARIRFLELKGGTWPAFWMLENRISEQPRKGDNDNVNWPNPGAGEIDVWEWYGNQGHRYITNFFNAGGPQCGIEKRIDYPGGAPDVMNFNTYGIEWDADSIKFFMNDQTVAEYDLSNCSQYEEPMFVLLNVAMGGTLGGNVDPTLQTATMEVDYVAHCIASEENSFSQCNESTPTVVDDDNDGVANRNDECPSTPEGDAVNSAGCTVFTEPQVAADDPSSENDSVVSIFSDSYTNISNVNFNPDWGQATQVTEIQIGGNNILKYEGLNYQGTDFETNKQDVSQLAFMHLDYWTHNSTELEIFVISPGPRETPFLVDVVQQEWQTLEIPMDVFTGVDLSDVFQLKVEGNGTVYLDNIFFSNGESQTQDSDGDGVNDAQDQCPNTMQGTTVDVSGCAIVPNLAPTAILAAIQNALSVSSVNTDAGTVQVNATISDANSDDNHTLVWNVTGLSTFDANTTSMSFDPSAINASQIAISVEVTDDGNPALSGSASMTLSVVSPAPAGPPPVNAPPEPSSSGGSMHFVLLFGLWLIAALRIKRPTNHF